MKPAHDLKIREPELEPLLSSRSFKRLLDELPDRSFRRWVSSGKIPAPDLRLGVRMFWRSSTVRAFLQNGKAL